VKYLYDTGVILRHRFAASWPGFRRGRERKTHSARGVVQTFAQFVALVPQCLPLVCLQSSLSARVCRRLWRHARGGDLRCLGLLLSGVWLRIRVGRERSGGGCCWIFYYSLVLILVVEFWRRSEDAVGFGCECGGERRFGGGRVSCVGGFDGSGQVLRDCCRLEN
jgi:hypothetical protein